MTTISVIIPAYNQGHYLAEAVDSVLAQTHQDFEIVVVDDGSTDHTAEVAQGYSDPRLHYVYQPNAGLSAARNTGIRHSSGELVTFLDSDDLFTPVKLEVLSQRLQADPHLGFVAGQAILIDRQGQPLEKTVGAGVPEELSRLLLGNPLHVGSVMVRRAWLDRVEPFDESLRACEDWDMWLRLALAGCSMGWEPTAVSLYRVHGDQMTRDAARMRKAMLATLDKVFCRPDLPPDWQALKSQAYAGSYLKAAARAYHQAAYEEAATDLAEVVRLDPSYLDNAAKRLFDQLVGWSTAPFVEDPLAYLERVFDHLPESLADLSRYRKRELARLGVQIAFDAYRKKDIARARKALLRALRLQPSWIKNRGVLAILARSWNVNA